MLNNTRSNEELQKSALTELKGSEIEEEKVILKDQIVLTKEIADKLADLDNKVELFDKSAHSEEQLNIQEQMEAGMKQVRSMQRKVDSLSGE